MVDAGGAPVAESYVTDGGGRHHPSPPATNCVQLRFRRSWPPSGRWPKPRRSGSSRRR